MRSAVIVPIALGAVFGAAHGQCITQFDLVASPSDSISMSLALPLAGTFIGNYNAATNPSGTQTRPGLFGGSGNNPIAYSSIVKPQVVLGLPQGEPVFTLCVGDDDGFGNVEVTCGSLDLIGGAPAPLTINITITYGNFNTGISEQLG